MLLAKGKSSFVALEEAKEQAETLHRTLRAHQQEIEILREALLTAEDRHSKTSSLLVEAETAIQTLTGESQHYQEHLKTLQRQSRPDSRDVLVSELNDRLAEQSAAFERKKHPGAQWTWERENERLRETAKRLEVEVLSLNEGLAAVRTEASNSVRKLQEGNKARKALEEKVKGLEETLAFKDLDLSVAKRKVERLTEELGTGSPWPEEPEKPPKPRASFLGLHTLESDSESCEEALTTLSPGGKSGSKHFTFDCFQPLLTIQILPGTELKGLEPDLCRKDPGQEYFTLTSQAVKLNSPYMDTICTVSTKDLYDKAVRNSIPFHKVSPMQWHVWIESQLTTAYLDSLYTSQNRKRGSIRRTGK